MKKRDADELAKFFDISKKEANDLVKSLNSSTVDISSLSEFLNHSLPLSSLRGAVIFFLVFFVDILMLLFIYADPYVELYRNLLVPPIILLHLFALWIIINPKKRQIASRLYLGVFAAFASVGYLVLIQKFLYSGQNLHSPFYGIVFVVGVLLGLVATCSYVVGKVKRGTFFDGGVNYKLIVSFSSIGVLVGHVVYSFFHWQGALLGVGILYLMSLVWMAFAVVMIYRYILIRRHPDLYIEEDY
ncbi:hypothetical protein [Tumebacillus flagellatus]|uniref:Uncharacterized protein n=1 Tax=Tumebacillus flagellatus TaxID=1157490 RepID=A0A074LU66_9BACL|nr:hypothetical protein [Tumebacillus flagellatus]KEO84594.1 hypothetical protein EL26_03495 [Tumebacillus flagellatus]